MNNYMQPAGLGRSNFSLKRLTVVLFLGLSMPLILNAQVIRPASVQHAGYRVVSIKNFIVPAAGIAYGLVSLQNHSLKSLNLSTNSELREDHPFFKSKLDNYAQFIPAATVFGLNAMGINGEHHLQDAALLYTAIIVANTAIVYPMKKITHVQRPDYSSFTSFPSGHTAIAFASAEFLRREYGKRYPWLAVAGYAVAAGTGTYRMLNNKHWFSDVVAGAGLGLASANIVYWLYDKVEKRSKSTILLPTISNNRYGLGLVKEF